LAHDQSAQLREHFRDQRAADRVARHQAGTVRRGLRDARLPGDFTPPSRFVRAVAFSQAAIASDTAQQSVLQAFHILNNFDIPLGSVRQMMGGTPIAEFTAWTSASDLKNLRWHFRTYNDQSIRCIDLRAALRAANGKVRTISIAAACGRPLDQFQVKGDKASYDSDRGWYQKGMSGILSPRR
jgi:penicillin V acylase-like amidase (Ntn superfamily)